MDPEEQSPDVRLEPPDRVRLVGAWTVLALREQFDALAARLAPLVAEPGQEWDLRTLTQLDNAGALALWQAWGGRRPSRLLARPEHEALFAQFVRMPGVRPALPARWPATADRMGGALRGLASHLIDITALLGRLLLDLSGLLLHPRLVPWREISANIYRTGAQALAITALVGFLVGVTLSYLTSKQLQAYGADIFVVNILGLGIPRELGPLLAAIIVAGRSGSAITAQLGVMRVTQELDALSVMGISHTVRLVLPKVLALALSLPLLVVWSSAMMLIGGMLAAQAELGLDPEQFARRLPGVVPVANLWLGWGKAAIFGALIALLASHFGLRIKPNTESLGAGVTQSVVISITNVIVVDALFAVLFANVGL